MVKKIDKKSLEDFYNTDLLSDKEIGKKIGVHYNTIRNLRKEYGIKSIHPRERERIKKGGFKEITDRQMSIILGSLLGDACLKGRSKNSRSFHISHSIKQKEYLEWMYEELKSLATDSGIMEYFDKRGYVTYYFNCSARKEFKDIWDSMYIPKKTVTKDYLDKLTNISIATWYLDDGSYNYYAKNKSEFRFATNCFSEEEHYLMKESLKTNFDLNFRVDHIKRASGYQCNLVLCNDSDEDFIKIVSPYVPPSMMYKIPSEERFNFLLVNMETKITKEDLERYYWDEEKSQQEISSLLNTSKSVIRKYMHLYKIPKRSKSESQKVRKGLSRDAITGAFQKAEWTNDDEEKALGIYRKMRGSGFPYYESQDPSSYCSILERLLKKDIEKDSDSSAYRFSSSGMKIIRDFCPQLFTMNRKGSLSPVQIYSDKDMFLDCIRRTIKYADKDSIAAVRSGLKTYRSNKGISNFPPIWAKTVINDLDSSNNIKMLDYSSGFGGRLVGAYTSGKVKEYLGIDPCKNNYDSVTKIGEVVDYHSNLSKKDFSWELKNITAEEYFEKFDEKFDLVLTSPPYFDLEVYENDKSQSYIKHNSYEDWLNNWHHKTLDSSNSALNNNGYCCVFISNNKENPLLDDTKYYMEKIFGNCRVQGFLLPNVEYNRNKNVKRLDYCLISKKYENYKII
jgi:hypothetical protein